MGRLDRFRQAKEAKQEPENVINAAGRLRNVLAKAKREEDEVEANKEAQGVAAGKELAELVKEFYELNDEANKARREADATRKKLLGKMQEHDLVSFEADGLVAEVGAPLREVVNINKLHDVIDRAAFFRCISASKAAVEEVAGKAICARVVEVQSGTINVTVKKL